MKIKVSIGGGSGFVAGELLRVLAAHPDTLIVSVLSTTHEGKSVTEVHDGLEELSGLKFADKISTDTDVLFLCLPHGETDAFLRAQAIPAGCSIIDLSRDHRGAGDPRFLYGLPEAMRERLREARASGLHVANPGCFATAIQLGLLPLLVEGGIQGDIHTSAVTGSTGAGRAQLPTLHYSWRHDNIQVYSAFTHSHLDEIRTTMKGLQPEYTGHHFFIPYRGPFTRGIIATSYTAFDGTPDDARDLYASTYAGHPFVMVSEQSPSLKQVVNTNRCIVSVDVIDGMCVTVSVIDNLLKGAAGQAVQNMNLLFGLDERSGLQLKASAF
ncbi:MAG: N-acetyl-gamma-glutamyl-phosphate reductase [Bacteroidetes bacterium]|nr:N-acetyl-gamma-glutamyl-phosphate reductase [Bacteroidota bacterium]